MALVPHHVLVGDSRLVLPKYFFRSTQTIRLVCAACASAFWLVPSLSRVGGLKEGDPLIIYGVGGISSFPEYSSANGFWLVPSPSDIYYIYLEWVD